MRCPNCNQPTFSPPQPCPQCQFQGDSALVEELNRLDWLLEEIDSWADLPPAMGQQLKQKYRPPQREIEVTLGLRLPPFTAEEAHAAWPDLIQREILRQKLGEWLAAGLTNPATTQAIVDQASRQIDELTERLEDYPRPDYPHPETEQLQVTTFLLEAVDYLHRANGFINLQAEQQALAPLLAEKERLEISLGLRPAAPEAPKPEFEAVKPEVLSAKPQPAASLPPTPLPPRSPTPPLPHPPTPPSPRAPLRDQIWRTLLSERTLQALLFLGIFLLFAAAISFVAWGWKDFSAPLRVAIPTAFTLIFFGLGWYVRAKTPLYRSGIALSAIAALLIPIDFYTVYVNFHVPDNYWPAFWLITSLFCLVAYIGATFIIRSRFFGYLVGVAAGSVILALIELGHQFTPLSTDWRTAGLSLLALGLILLSTRLDKNTTSPPPLFPYGTRSVVASSPLPLSVTFADPFRYLALLAIGVLMLFSFGWRYTNRDSYDTLHYATSLNWWIGGLIFAWGAIHFRSRSLSLLAAITLPIAVYLTQAAIFDRLGVNPAWHGVGLALLVPLYFITGHRLLARQDDPLIYGHGRTATGWGVALLLIAALWSLTDLSNGTAAAVTHAILAGAIILAAWLWQRPRYLYAASFLALSASTFAMTELNLTLSQLGVGWASLAIAHVLMAVYLGTRFPMTTDHRPQTAEFVPPLVNTGYIIAALAVIPALFPYDSGQFVYTLGNWLGLTAWGAWLAHHRQPGFGSTLESNSLKKFRFLGWFNWRETMFHWFTAAPLPVWMWVLFTHRRPADSSLALALAVLAWGMVWFSYRLARANPAYRRPWRFTGMLVSVVAILASFAISPTGFAPALALYAAGLLYFADALTQHHPLELAPAGLVTAWGYSLWLDRLGVSVDSLSFALALLVGVYILAGLTSERQKSPVFTRRFLSPLYLTAHAITLIILGRIYLQPLSQVIFHTPWTDTMRYWEAAAQMVLALIYGLYAWGTFRERWGHVAVWLAVAGGGLVVVNLSHGRGSSAAGAAVMAAILVLTERGLHWACHQSPQGMSQRQRAFFRLTWRLFRRPLLVAGWTISGVAIGLALIRNLWWLGGGRIQQIWAAAGLLVVTGLYLLSARLFRRPLFMWLAALLIFAPWTILTNLGWFTPYVPTFAGFALSWAILAWTLFLGGWGLSRLAGRAYGLPLKTVAQVLLPFSLVWGIANVDTSRFTFALAIGFYTLAAILDYWAARQTDGPVSVAGKTKFLYPALGLWPVWSVYLLAWVLPPASHEIYGLLLLLFGSLGLVAGQTLKRLAPRPALAAGYALPAYLTGYGALIVGTMLTAHNAPLLALVLLFDALLLLVSARLFRNPLWGYPAAALAPLSLLLALHEAGVPGNRYGWWLIGLAWVYLALAWALRRGKLTNYAAAPLTAGFALVALGLPPSSQDQIGAIWGYGGAALLYGVSAFWLRQPLLLTPACALMVVPYAIGLERSALEPRYYGLALFPGAVLALALGWGLDRVFGDWRNFPWGQPAAWFKAAADRLLGWWALPLYMLGFGLASVSPMFTNFEAGLTALNFLLLMPVYGWAIYYFRRRGWLLAVALAGHLAAVYYLESLGWWQYPAWAWVRFLPVTLITVGVALFIEKRWQEGSPLNWNKCFVGWSRPLYLIVLVDIIVGQWVSLSSTEVGAMVTLTHTLILLGLASVWLSPWLAYASLTLGIGALIQWLSTFEGPIERLPIALAGLALAYGLGGYGLAQLRMSLPRQREVHPWLRIWELPLQRISILFSWGILVLTAWLGLDLIGWTVRALLGASFRQMVDLMTVQMAVGVLGLLGLLYLTAAYSHRWQRLGYAAIGILLAAWMLHIFYVQQWENMQWYAIPAGLYLLMIAYLEWQRGHKTLGRWLDYAAMGLMLGSLFWQTLLYGWEYALLLGVEGLLALWWGSARRLRRFFYAGILAVVLATVGQLINSLSSINQWIVFGIIGLLLVVVAVIVERKLESIKAWHETLELWE